MPKQLFLLDGYAMLYRAHFAFINNPLRNSRGEDTSAIYGLLLQLGSLLNTCNPPCLAFVFDSKTPTFRHKEYPDYKATREKMPEGLRGQIIAVRELLERGLKIPILELEGYEADDVIGTMARLAEKNGMEAVIVSGDKDFHQLVSEGIKLYNPRGRGEEAEWVDLSNATERLGVPPEKTIDLLSLMGDSSDNVPGVRGIGKVTAIKLLTQYDSLDDIYAHLDEVKPEGVRKKLAECREEAYLSRRLVTIRTDLELGVELEALVRCEPDIEALDELFTRFEIRSLRERFGLGAEVQRKEKKTGEKVKDYRLVESLEELTQIAGKIAEFGCFAVDVETTSKDPMRAELVGISLAWEPDRGYYLPLAHRECPNLEREGVLGILRPLLESEKIGCIGQNIKYDMIVLARYGAEVRNIIGDPMVASYLLDPGRRSHGLDALA